jgi:hypothetical protein
VAAFAEGVIRMACLSFRVPVCGCLSSAPFGDGLGDLDDGRLALSGAASPAGMRVVGRERNPGVELIGGCRWDAGRKQVPP